VRVPAGVSGVCGLAQFLQILIVKKGVCRRWHVSPLNSETSRQLWNRQIQWWWNKRDITRYRATSAPIGLKHLNAVQMSAEKSIGNRNSPLVRFNNRGELVSALPFTQMVSMLLFSSFLSAINEGCSLSGGI